MSNNEEFPQRQSIYLTTSRHLLQARVKNTQENLIATLIEAGVPRDQAYRPESVDVELLRNLPGKKLNLIESRSAEVVDTQRTLTLRDRQIERIRDNLKQFGNQSQ